MRAKDYLLQLNKLERLIEHKRDEIDRLKEMATSSTAPMDSERVQTSSTGQALSNAICSYVDLQEEVEWDLYELEKKRKDIISKIETLPTIEYDILYRRYVQGYEFQDIAVALEKSYSWVTSKHGTALVKLQEVIDK